MFNLTDETRTAIIAVLREQLVIDNVTDEELNSIIDEIVTVVKKQFGM